MSDFGLSSGAALTFRNRVAIVNLDTQKDHLIAAISKYFNF